LTDAAVLQSTVGREAELGIMSRFFDAVRQGCGALVLQGEPGIGKTTLWRDGVGLAQSRSYRVLTSCAGPGEAEVPFAVLGDLFDQVDEAMDRLPRPQAHALAVALLRTESADGPPDPRSISVAGLGVLRHLSSSGPVVVAIDNVQWVDAASYRVLEYALRRLVDEPVGILLTRRPRDRPRDPFTMSSVLNEERLQRVSIGPLSEDEIGELVVTCLGAAFPRRLVSRIHDMSRGNPFFALQLAMGAQRGTDDGDADDVSISSDLQELLLERVAVLPEGARRAALIVAMAAQATSALLRSIMGNADAELCMDRAIDAGVLELTGDRVRFTHPLIGSALSAAALPGEKRSVHAELARASSEPEERARHRALASFGPDAAVADQLDAAALAVKDRGAPEVAAGLCDLAQRLTPPDRPEDTARRRIDAVDCLLLAGHFGRATRVLTDALASEPIGLERARLLFRLGRCLPLPLAGPTFEEALVHARGDARLETLVHEGLSDVHLRMGRLPDAAREASAALDTANALPDDRLLMEALTATARVEFYLGHDLQSDLLGRALALQHGVTDRFPYLTPGTVLGRQLVWSGRLDEARRRLHEQRQRARDHGDEWAYARTLEILVDLECRAGNFMTAAAYAEEEYDIAVHIDEGRLHGPLLARALAAAHLGRVDDARRDAESAMVRAEQSENRIFLIRSHHIIGYIALSLGGAEDAVTHLRLADALTEDMGCADPGIFPLLPDAIEALVAAGELEDAEALVERLATRAARLRRPWAVSCAARCRALLLGAAGHLEAAERSAQSARETMPPQFPFEIARTMLVLGTVQRRMKQKRLARASLERARGAFVEMGAELWARRSGAELDRIGGRAPSPLGLTPTEEQVASLVSEGLTNREIATNLYMSVKTVETNLSRIYRKLGVRSRTELVHRLATPRVL
jgi:DNA-binding CsgD family transcriptional regulator